MFDRKQLIKLASKKIDDLLPFDKYGELLSNNVNAFLGGGLKFAGSQIEKRDHEIIEFAITKVYDRFPEQYKDELDLILQAFITGDITQLSSFGVDELVEMVNTPFGDKAEKEFITSIFKAILTLLSSKLKTQSAQEKSIGGGGGGDDPTNP